MMHMVPVSKMPIFTNLWITGKLYWIIPWIQPILQIAKAWIKVNLKILSVICDLMVV